MADSYYRADGQRFAADVTDDEITPKIILTGEYGALPETAGYTASADFTPAAAAYGAGDIIGVPREFIFTDRNGVLVPAGSLIRILTAVMKIDVTAVPSGQTSYLLPLYSVTPPSAQADNDLWTGASADLPSYRGDINLGTPVDKGSFLYVKSQYIDFDIRLPAGLTSLWGRLVTVGAFTATGVVRQITLHAMTI